MMNTTALMLFLWPHMLYEMPNATVSVPFTHDFDTGLHGWSYEPEYWDWTGNATRSPDTSSIPYFQTIGENVWTQESFPEPHNSSAAFYLFRAESVTRSTKFTFRYWFSATVSDKDTGLYLYIMDLALNASFLPVAKITESDDNWRYITIDCTGSTCCSAESPSDCDVQIQIVSSVGAIKETGIAAIACVTTEDYGCGLTTTTTTTTPTTTTPKPSSSPLTSTPNILITAAFILMSFSRHLFR